MIFCFLAGRGALAGLGMARGVARAGCAGVRASAGTCLTIFFFTHFKQYAALRSGEKNVALQTEQVRRNFIPLIAVS
jgi:hypothetical protein